MSVKARLTAALFLVQLLVAPAWAALEKSVTTAPSPLTGLWWNPAESGWGASIAQHGTMIFVAWYTYDTAGKPAWYVSSACRLSGAICTGDLHSVAGGSALTSPWGNPGLAINHVGAVRLTFTDNDNATFDYTLHGVPGSRHVTRQSIAAGPQPSATNYSDLWWNSGESGWGIAITQQAATIFATIFTYDANGLPMWYVASDCRMSGDTCTGALYRVNGGTAPSVPWSGANLSAPSVGSLTLSFTGPSSATLQYTIDGVSGQKAITRQDFAGEGHPANPYSDVFDAIQQSSNGGWRSRGINVKNGLSSSVGCSYGETPDRQTIESLVNGAGGQVTLSTPTEWCGRLGSESNCLKLFGAVVVLDQRDGGSVYTELYMPGLLADRKTMVIFTNDAGFAYATVNSERKDSSVSAGANNCNNGSQPAQARTAIDGDWIGYSVDYSPSSNSISQALSTMSCRNQTCTILGADSVTVAFSSPTLWRTAAGAPRLAGASVSTDQSLASAFVCNAATVVESQPFENCTFHTFKR